MSAISAHGPGVGAVGGGDDGSAAAALRRPRPDAVPAEWVDHSFVREHGELTRYNVLDYFATSPYFDPACAHAKLMVQGGVNPWDKRNLRDFDRSIQYELRHAPVTALPPPPSSSSSAATAASGRADGAPFFVIEEQFVEMHNGKATASVTGVFVVQELTIIPAPDVRSVVKNRLDNMKDLIETAFTTLEGLTSYSQALGTAWVHSSANETEAAVSAAELPAAADDAAAAFSWKQDLARLAL